MLHCDPLACEEGLAHGREPQPPPKAGKAHRVLVVWALVLSGVVTLAVACFSESSAAKTTSRLGEEVTQLALDTTTVCDNYPYFKLEEGAVVYSNLGNQGPDSGQGEGMVIITRDVGGGTGAEYGHEVKLLINATDAPAGAFDPRINGRSGEYMQIGVMSGYDVPVRISFVEAKTGKPLVVPKFALTFFDLDAAEGMKSKESVVIMDFAHHRTSSHTEVRETAMGSETKFAASTVGKWDDGPTNPHFLTQQQKNRAVSLLFHSKSELRFTLSAGAGQGARFFNMAARPSMYCAVTMQEGAKPPLDDLPVHPPMQRPIISKHGETFVEFLVGEGDEVSKDDPLYRVTDRNGEERTYNAPMDGVVVAMQDELKKGDLVDQRTTNHVIAVVGVDSFAPLPVNEITDDTPQGKYLSKDVAFKKYLKNQWDPVEEGDGIIVVADDSGKETIVKATGSGVVKARHEGLESGDSLSLVADGNLMTIGKLGPLPTDEENTPLKLADSRGEGALRFVKYAVKEGDSVDQGSTIAIVRGSDGSARALKSSKPGVVTGIQAHLKEGMVLENVMQDKTLATVGKLRPLEVHHGEQGAMGPGDNRWEFDMWLADVGDLVKKGDPICRLRVVAGFSTKTVKAPKTGTVERRQEHLKKGDPVDVMADHDFAVVGKIASPDVSPLEKGVTAPGDAVFERWLMQDGERIRFMQPLVEVSLPTRRLVEADGTVRRLAATTMQLPAPGSGYINWMAPLNPGETIGSQQTGGTIAKIYVGPPWWLLLLFALMVLCCLLCALFVVMKKPIPYTPMEPEPPAPEPQAPELVEEPPPEGLRLDFDENGTIHTVYAKYRPLGIKHNELVPIIAHDFTINSYAKMDLKVQKGWKLVRIGDADVHDSTDFSDVSHKLVEHMKDFPLWPLPLMFKKQREENDTQELTVKFLERPLGLVFSNHAPIQILKVMEDSPAYAAGIKEGWFLTGVGEYDVHNNSDFRDVMKHFKEGVKALDDSGKKFHSAPH